MNIYSIFHNIEAATSGLSLQIYKKGTLAQVFSCEFCEISKNIFGRLLLITFISKILLLVSFITFSMDQATSLIITNGGGAEEDSKNAILRVTYNLNYQQLIPFVQAPMKLKTSYSILLAHHNGAFRI